MISAKDLFLDDRASQEHQTDWREVVVTNSAEQ